VSRSDCSRPTSRHPQTDWVIVLAMKGNSDHPSVATPEFSSALATTLSAAPAAFALVYRDIVRGERVPVTTAIWNLNDDILAAAISARERDHGRAITRKHAPDTICNVLHRYAPGCNVREP